MKNRYYILLICLITVFIALNSCSESKVNDTSVGEQLVFSDFNTFPNTPFLNLEFNDLLDNLKSDLEELDYLDQSDYIYSHNSDSTTIIFTEEANLTTFKVYLKSEFYLSNNEQLFKILSENATHYIGTYDFAEMEFKKITNPFNLTYFSTGKFIRISYQLVTPHH